MGVSDTRGMNTKHHRRPNHECFSSIRTGVLDTLVNQFSLPCVALIAIQHLEAGLREIFVDEEIPDGNYVFYISADDDADLFLSTDDTVANKKLIASEPVWNDSKKWVLTDRRNADHPENRSDQFQGTQWPTKNTDGGATIALKKGNKYYIEAVQHEGGGGDNVGVNFKLATDADPADGDDTLMVAATIGHWEPGAVVTAPGISIGLDGKIAYTGTLTGSDNAAGPYAPVAGASSPFTPNTGAAAQKFYRSSN